MKNKPKDEVERSVVQVEILDILYQFEETTNLRGLIKWKCL